MKHVSVVIRIETKANKYTNVKANNIATEDILIFTSVRSNSG